MEFYALTDRPQIQIQRGDSPDWEDVLYATSVRLAHLPPDFDGDLLVEVLDVDVAAEGEILPRDIDPEHEETQLRILYESGATLGPFCFTNVEKLDAENEDDPNTLRWTLVGPMWARPGRGGGDE